MLTSYQNLQQPPPLDVTIVVSDGSPFHGHLAILSSSTTFFEMALSKTSGFTESANNTVNLPDHSARAVSGYLEWVYYGHYQSYVKNSPEV